MRALLLTELLPDFKGLQLKDIASPKAGEDMVPVRVRAASLNFVDLLQSSGRHQHKPPVPSVLGSDFSGERMDTGEPVWGMARGGAFAEEIAVPAAALSPKPDSWSFAEAAAYGQPYLTALVTLKRHAFLEPGQWLLVHGASAGVGLAAVDLAKRMGIKVIATSGSDEKLAKVQELYGVDHVLNADEPFREKVKEITGGGAHAVYDPVGGDVFRESLRCTRYFGRLLIIGWTSGDIPDVKMNYPLIKGLQIVGVRAGEYGRHFPEHGAEDRQQLADMALNGEAQPHVHAALPLSEWREGFAMMERREVVGRVVLEP